MNTEPSFAGDFRGTFFTDAALMAEKLKGIKAILFDWDGVFNNGHKTAEGSSSYSEIDAMGTNLLRFSRYLDSKTMPYVAVMTGETNPAAFILAKREHFNAVYYSVKHKQDALEHLCRKDNLKPSEVLFVFDDVLDFTAAKLVGLRMMVTHSCNSILTKFAVNRQLVDYLTYHDGDNGAIREITELVLTLSRRFDETIENRMLYSDIYREYLKKRNEATTQFYTVENNALIQRDPS
jgi:3-deoxy-D-manno-octulosonate 8-phosphate phosphatase (KDO 8-P phosphatase)